MNALATAARRFRAAHHGQRPLVLPNVWDCASARVLADAGFAALATSSSAVAATLGYADGQQTPVAEMFAAERGHRYLAAGADCCYPILAPLTALPGLVADMGGPVNAMSRPGGPSLAELAATGVARITFGGSLHQRATDELAATARALREAETVAAPAR